MPYRQRGAKGERTGPEQTQDHKGAGPETISGPASNSFIPQRHKKSTSSFPEVLLNNRVATTYSPTFYGSTIGAAGLNFSVRDGKRWTPAL